MASWKSWSMALVVGMTGCGQLAEGFFDAPYTGDAFGRNDGPVAVTVNIQVKQGNARQWAQKRGLSVVKEFPELRAVTVAAPEGAHALVTQLEQDPSVAFAEADLAVSMPRITKGPQSSLMTSLGSMADPLERKQYSLDVMQVRDAWKFSRGQGVKVGVIDFGFDYDHQDLRNQLLPGFNAWHGVAGRLFSGAKGDPNKDQVSHGSHVAGIIAAQGQNGLGITGVAPEAKVFPVRISPDLDYQAGRQAFDPFYGELAQKLEAQDKSAMSVLVGAILAATVAKVDVLNMSLGVTPQQVAAMNGGKGGAQAMQGLQLYLKAVEFATKNGVTVLVAAGNERQEGSPTNLLTLHPAIVTVGATDQNDEIAPFSNSSKVLSVSAPGVNVLSTVPATIRNATFPYEAMSGTSMATPNVAGVVALMKATNPALDPVTIKKILMATAEDRGPEGPDPDFGFGRVNAFKAVAVAAKLRQAP